MSDQPAPASPAPRETPAPARAEGPGGGGPGSGGPGGGGPRRESHGGGGGGPRREGGGPGGPGGPRRGGKRQYFRKKKVCRFCVDHVDFIDYKRVEMLQPFVQERGKILPRRMTGTCSRHQRWLGEAIKRARNIALLPFATEL
jgi:small subunit ribosomal protein S18